MGQDMKIKDEDDFLRFMETHGKYDLIIGDIRFKMLVEPFAEKYIEEELRGE